MRGALSALVIPVAAATPVVGEDPAVPPHVTLLAPFLPREELTEGLLAELGALFADVVAFSFELDEVCAFPSGVAYLAPHPAAPFRQLTGELVRRFPALPPSGGQLADIVPHLPLPTHDGETLADVERRVARHGPLRGLATEVQLLWVADASHEVVATFPFGTAAA